MTTLLLSSRFTEDNQALWRAAVELGWNIERVRGLTLPVGLATDEIVLFVESLFAPAIAEQLGLTLVEVAEDWLVRLPADYRKRNIQLTTLGDARRLAMPCFVKPPNDKSFPAKVYESRAELPTEFEDDTAVLVAEPVSFEVEYRSFVLDREIRTLSPYLRFGQLARANGFAAPESERAEAHNFASRLLADAQVEFPRAVALDVGRIEGKGWAAVELNAAWGSGIYGCDPNEVLRVIQHAVIPGQP